jgi:hypothetical protein
MTLRRKILCLCALLFIAAIAAVRSHDRFIAGPAYAGVPLSLWLRVLDDPSPQNRDQARQVIRKLGPAAVPLIIEWLDWKDSLFRRLLTAWVTGDEEHINFHPIYPKDRRRLALAACDALGPAAGPVIPKLAALARARNPELDAPFLIARIGGSNAAPALVRLTASTNKFIIAAAVVSADLLREKSTSLLHDPSADSEDNDYRRRLEEYHVLVMQAVTSGRASNQPAAIR